jgi:murein DD-endopeptidase MepM/ murein hydrolase activator NlpD
MQRSTFHRDYKRLPTPNRFVWFRLTHTHWIIFLSGIILTGLVLLLNSGEVTATRDDTLQQTSTQPTRALSSIIDATQDRITLPLDLPAYYSTDDNDHQGSLQQNKQENWRTVIVKKGDSLASIFSHLDLNSRQLYSVLRLGQTIAPLKRLMPGEVLKFDISNHGLEKLIYEIDEIQALHIVRDSDGFSAALVNQDLEKRVTNATGTIDTSLFVAAQHAGLSDNLTMKLASLFGWDIDFALDIRTGDQFALVYEEFYRDGEKVRDGNILAAEFVNQGKEYKAVQYTNPNGRSGYYSPDGRNMRKNFLRTPVEFTRISSRFGKRFHPVLNRFRVHQGVDYAAPRGTPIKATGDGKIIYLGRKGGYGKTIIVQHGLHNQTLYAHMSNYRRGLRKGRSVKQGQIIGYVGSTGLATGPHLHYEFRIDGVHRNPLTVKFASADPVPNKYEEDFKAKTSVYVALLEMLGETRLALSQ